MESVLPPHHLVNHAGVALDDFDNLALLFLPDSIFKWLDDVVIETPYLFQTSLYKIIEISCFFKVLLGISQPAFIACKTQRLSTVFRYNFEHFGPVEISTFHNYIWYLRLHIGHYYGYSHRRYNTNIPSITTAVYSLPHPQGCP